MRLKKHRRLLASEIKPGMLLKLDPYEWKYGIGGTCWEFNPDRLEHGEYSSSYIETKEHLLEREDPLFALFCCYDTAQMEQVVCLFRDHVLIIGIYRLTTLLPETK